MLSPTEDAAPDLMMVSSQHLRSTVSTKWGKHGPDVIGAWIADMDFAVAPAIAEAVHRYVTDGFFGYGLAALRDDMVEAFANWWRPYGLDASPERVVLVSELVQAMHACVAAFSEPGDGVLILTPVYPPFFGAITEQRRRVVEYRMFPRSGAYRFDADELRSLVDAKRPRMILLCHPHNPVGRVWTAEELTAIATIAEDFEMLVVSDEVHADLVFAPHTFRSFESLRPGLGCRTITITSPSKSFNIAGLRCALMHFGSNELLATFRDRVRGDLLGVPSVPGMISSIAAWQHGRPWLDTCIAQLHRNRDAVGSELLHADTGISGTTNEATYLQWLDFSALPGVKASLAANPGSSVSDLLRKEAGVGCNNGADFGPGQEHFARLNFATSPEILSEICTRIVGFASSNS